MLDHIFVVQNTWDTPMFFLHPLRRYVFLCKKSILYITVHKFGVIKNILLMFLKKDH